VNGRKASCRRTVGGRWHCVTCGRRDGPFSGSRRTEIRCRLVDRLLVEIASAEEEAARISVMSRPIGSSWRHPVSWRPSTSNLPKRQADSIRFLYFHKTQVLFIIRFTHNTTYLSLLHSPSRRLVDCRQLLSRDICCALFRTRRFVVRLFLPPPPLSLSPTRYAGSSLLILCRVRNPFLTCYFAPAHVSCIHSVTPRSHMSSMLSSFRLMTVIGSPSTI
jgi:hypothetical protein